MEEPKRGIDDEMDDTEEPKKGGAIRHRKKLIINKLRAQMEFYFSAANLSKDKFMNNLLQESPYIELEIFFKFNRIRTLTDDMNLLRKAIQKSPILELSEDGLRLKRSQAVNLKEDEVTCTIYVENIPSHVDHEWVHEMFAKYGTIDYISFPRFKSTGRPKGFAFIEFENSQMANLALETFGSLGCTIPPDTEPSKLRSICTHEGVHSENNKQLQSGEGSDQSKMEISCGESAKNIDLSKVKDMLSDENGDKETVHQRKGEGEEVVRGKRKIEEVDDTESDTAENAKAVPAQKKSKANSSEIDKVPEVDDSSAEKEKKTEDSFGETPEETGDKETKKRKLEVEDVIKEVRRNVDKAKGVTDPVKEEKESSLSPKKRSLDESGKEPAKKSKKRKVIVDTTDSGVSADMAVEEAPPAKVKSKRKKRKRSRREKVEPLEDLNLKVMSKQEWTRLRNQYLNMQKRNMESLKWDLHNRKYIPDVDYRPPSETVSKNQPQFVANAVIKISFEAPPQDPKKLQEAIREGGRGGVAYVETSAVEKDVFVRFVSGEAAAAYLEGGVWSRMKLLSGEEEKEYWNHCVNSWLMRRNKKNKRMKGTSNDVPNKFRGREKLLQKALRDAGSDKPNSHKVFEG